MQTDFLSDYEFLSPSHDETGDSVTTCAGNLSAKIICFIKCFVQVGSTTSKSD
ncbi:MAG: hypothetical protein KA444_02515 [Bacteroidia bacterium]|nr:hypothetical protein [Bacteroidia bacterium]